MAKGNIFSVQVIPWNHSMTKQEKIFLDYLQLPILCLRNKDWEILIEMSIFLGKCNSIKLIQIN